MGWTAKIEELSTLDTDARAVLDALPVRQVPAETVLFSPGDDVTGYVIPLKGRINVCLIGPTGRDILLYEVNPGQSCIQTTLGLMGEQSYSAEAHAETDLEIVLIPKSTFLNLLERSEPFRQLVFATFAFRFQTMMQLLEKVAFLRVEERLAEALIYRQDATAGVTATQAELATMVGSAREVVARKLALFAKQGLVELGRGRITILDEEGLRDRMENSE